VKRLFFSADAVNGALDWRADERRPQAQRWSKGQPSWEYAENQFHLFSGNRLALPKAQNAPSDVREIP